MEPELQCVAALHSPLTGIVDPRRADDFYAEERKYWPELPDHSLHPAYCGAAFVQRFLALEEQPLIF